MKLNLPLIGGFIDSKRGFEAASALQDFLDLKEERFPIKGFFFRAEDFSHFVDSIDRQNRQLESQFYDLSGEVPDHVIDQMKNSSNFAHQSQRRQFGQDLITFSHGKAYMKIMHERITKKGI